MDILKLRKVNNLTQVELAKLISVSVTTIRLWEQGVTTPKEENLKKLKKLKGDKGDERDD